MRKNKKERDRKEKDKVLLLMETRARIKMNKNRIGKKSRKRPLKLLSKNTLFALICLDKTDNYQIMKRDLSYKLSKITLKYGKEQKRQI